MIIYQRFQACTLRIHRSVNNNTDIYNILVMQNDVTTIKSFIAILNSIRNPKQNSTGNVSQMRIIIYYEIILKNMQYIVLSNLIFIVLEKQNLA